MVRFLGFVDDETMMCGKLEECRSDRLEDDGMV